MTSWCSPFWTARRHASSGGRASRSSESSATRRTTRRCARYGGWRGRADYSRALARRRLRRLDALASAVVRRARTVRGARRLLLAPLALIAAAAHQILVGVQRRWETPSVAASAPPRAPLHRALLRVHKPSDVPRLLPSQLPAALALMRPLPRPRPHAPVAAALARRHRRQALYDAHELYPDISTLVSVREPHMATPRATADPAHGSRADRVRFHRGRPLAAIRHHPADRPTQLPVASATSLRLRNGVIRLRGPLGVGPRRPGRAVSGGFSPTGVCTRCAERPAAAEEGGGPDGLGTLEDELRATIETEGLRDRIMLCLPSRSQTSVHSAHTPLWA